MKRVVVLLLNAVMTAFMACADVLYVKPGATGSGASWADAADLAEAVRRAREGSGVTTIYAAKGVYTQTETLKLNGSVALYGGFAGASAEETPETRDLKENATIISGDVNGDGVWARYYPLTGEMEETSEPIVKNGRINDLALANDFDTYAPANKNHGDNLLRVVTIMEGAVATCVLDGVTITGGGRGITTGGNTTEDGCPINYGSSLFVAANSSPVIRNCRIVGNTAIYACVFFHSSAVPTFENNEISFSQSFYKGAFYSQSSTATLQSVRFVGNVRSSDGNSSGAAAVTMNGSLALRGCLFARNYLYKFRPNSPAEAVCICADDYSTFNVADSTFLHNSCYDTYGATPAPVVMPTGNKSTCISASTFASNVITCVSSAAEVKVAGIVSWSGTSYGRIMAGCAIFDNKISVTASTATKVAATPVFGTISFDTCSHIIVNSTFSDNTVDVSAPQAEAVEASRAVLFSSDKGMSYVFNSTFAGDEPLADIRFQNGTGLKVINSVLWAEGDGSDVPRIVGAQAADISVDCSIVCRSDLLGEHISLSETTGMDPLLQPLETPTAGGVPVVRIGAKLPGVRDTYDVASFSYYNDTPYAYRRTPSSAWQHCYGNSGTKVLISDALGSERPAGSFTIGAVQALTDKAENGCTVIFDVDPAHVARIEGNKTQVVGLGETTLPVKAVSTDEAYSFRRWRAADGSEYSTDNPLTVSATSPGTLVLTAQFNPATVRYEFDLGEFATFDDDGSTNKVLTLEPDSAMEIPAYTIREGFSFKAWSPEVPATVGTLDAKFDLRAFRRDTYLKPGDDIASAVREAGNYDGVASVFLATGVYEPASDFVLPSNVKLIGEKGTVVRRSAENQWTIKNSVDTASPDKGWLEISGITFERGGVFPGVNPVRLTDCVFTNCVNGENGAVCLYTNAVVVGCGFYDCQMAIKAVGSNSRPISFWATNSVFRGNRNAVASGGRQFGAAAALGSCMSTVFSLCRFEKNWSANQNSAFGILSGSSMTLDRCQFVDNVCTGDLNLIQLGYAKKCTLVNTLFLRNRVVGENDGKSTLYAALIGDGNLADKSIIGCAFLSNVVDRTEAATSARTQALPCSILWRNGTYKDFRYNYFEGNSVKAVAANPEIRPICSIVSIINGNSNYSMEGNTFYGNTAEDGTIYVAGGTGGIWIWNSLFSGTGAANNPITFASDDVTSKVYYRFSVAPVQNDARIVRDDTCKAGPVAFGDRLIEVDGLIVRPIADAPAARTNPVRWYYTANDRKTYYNESKKTYLNMAGDASDSYLIQPYTPVADMFGEVSEGRKAMAGAYQKRVEYGMAIIVR